MSREDAVITSEQAEGLLPDGEDIHTFLNGSGMLLGADWSRKEVLAGLQSAKVIKLTGEMAREMGHGIAFIDEKAKGWVFVSTDKTKLDAFDVAVEATSTPEGAQS